MHFLDKTTGNINSLEDRLWLAANLVALEEHAYSSYLRTSDWRYAEMMEKFREERILVFRDILGIGAATHEAELWCMFKHTLGAAMRAYESGNRETVNNPSLASFYFGISKKMIEQMFDIIEMTALSEDSMKYSDRGVLSALSGKENSQKEYNRDDNSHIKDSGSGIKTEELEKSEKPGKTGKKEKRGLLYYLRCCLE